MKILAKSMQKRDKRNVIHYLRAFQKLGGRVNRVDQWCIFLYLGGFEVLELHDVEQWVKVITEIPDIELFPINNPSIINNNKMGVPL